MHCPYVDAYAELSWFKISIVRQSCFTDHNVHYYFEDDKDKSKEFPYSLPSVGPGADPGVQAVSLQVT